MGYLAAIAVDRRQNFILGSDKLREMMGASRMIEASVKEAEALAGEKRFGGSVTVIRPVSGEVWVSSGDLPKLAEYLRDLRAKLVGELRMSVTFAVINEDGTKSFRAACNELEQALREQKSNRAGQDGTPHLPLFARCRVQPDQTANVWSPDAARNDEWRRDLVSKGSEIRLEKAKDYWPELAKEFPDLLRFKKHDWPKQLSDLATNESDSYIAFIKGDVDALGSVQMKFDWNGLGGDPKETLEKFSRAIATTVRKAVFAGMAEALGTQIFRQFPFLPLVMAGDDIWILADRRFALPFAIRAGQEFARLARESEDITRVTGELSISFGVLFAKQGYPIDQQLDLADEILKSAKKFRKHGANPGGCIDYFWLASSGRGRLKKAREEGAGYFYTRERQKKQIALFTRPWTLDDAGKIQECAMKMSELPRNKLRQLDSILRFGGELTGLAMHNWWSRLTLGEQRDLNAALAQLPKHLQPPAPLFFDGGKLPVTFKDNRTVLLELAELGEIAARQESEEASHAAGDR